MTGSSVPPPVPQAVVEATLGAWAEAGRRSRWPVEGNSMWPLLQTVDRAVISHGDRTLCRGDVVAYRQGAQPMVIHRLLRREGSGMLLFAGDNVPFTDALVSPDAVLGRVVAVHTPAGERTLTSRTARAFGWLLAVSHPLLGRRGLSWVAAGMAQLAARILRA